MGTKRKTMHHVEDAEDVADMKEENVEHTNISTTKYASELMQEIKIRLKRQNRKFIHEHGESILLLLSCVKRMELYSQIVELYHFLVPFFDPAEPCVVLASRHLQLEYPKQPLVQYDDIDALLTVENLYNGKATNGLIAQGLALCAHSEQSQSNLLLRGKKLVAGMKYEIRIGPDRKLRKESEHLIYFTTHLILLNTMYGMQKPCISFNGWEQNMQRKLELLTPYKEENLDVYLELSWCIQLLTNKINASLSKLPPIRATPTFIHCALLWLLHFSS